MSYVDLSYTILDVYVNLLNLHICRIIVASELYVNFLFKYLRLDM
jgi:hypothetical protein